MKKINPDAFVRAYTRAKSIDAVARHFQISKKKVVAMVKYLRKQGVNLPEMELLAQMRQTIDEDHRQRLNEAILDELVRLGIRHDQAKLSGDMRKLAGDLQKIERDRIAAERKFSEKT